MVITPTDSTKEIAEKYYKDLNIKSIEHGMDKIENKYDLPECQDKKNIAFIGGINKVKGIDFLEKFIDEVNKPNGKYVLHLFGDTSDNRLNVSKENYIYHGRYDREDITKLLKENGIDLVCILSIWPETYSYTLTESLLAEVPVLVMDYGAISERTKKDNLGWVLDRDVDFQGVLEKINDIFVDEKNYKKIKNSIKKYLKNVKTTEQMAKEYEEVYNKFINKKIEKYSVLSKESVSYILKHSKEISDIERTIIGRTDVHNHRIAEYHYTVTEYRKEIDRLNEEIAKYQQKDSLYNNLLSSRRLKLLKKIRFIKF